MSILFEIGLASILIYVPFMNQVLQTEPVQLECWLWTLPIIGIMLALEEIRKLLIRCFPGSVVEQILLA